MWQRRLGTQISLGEPSPAAPTGHNEIAQGRAKRHPGYTGELGAPTPQFAKALKGRNMCALIDAPPVPPFQGLGCFVHTESQGGASLCPGLSPCAPLGHKTIGLRSMNPRSRRPVWGIKQFRTNTPFGNGAIGHRQPRESTDGYNFVE